MKLFRSTRGSLTVEAALTLPLYICIVLTFAFFMRVIYVHEVVQHAINDTANELASYSYLYSVTGLQKQHDKATDTLDERRKVSEDHAKDIVGAYESLSKSRKEAEDTARKAADEIKNIDVNHMLNDLGSLQDKYKGLKDSYTKEKELIEQSKADIEKIYATLKTVWNDPKKEAISIASIFLDNAFGDLKAALSTPVIKFCAQKHFRTDEIKDADVRIKKLHIEGGYDSLDFSQSRIFEDKQSIDIVVRYKVKNIVPIKFLPDFYIIQRASVRGWLDGVGRVDKPAEVKVENLWELGSTVRGTRIQEKEGRNLPGNFPVVTIENDGHLIMVRSIDLNAASYLKPSRVESVVKGYIKDMAAFQGAKFAGKEILKENIKSKKIVIVFPEGTLQEGVINPDIKAVLDKYSREPDNKGITVVLKEGYGTTTKAEENNTGSEKK